MMRELILDNRSYRRFDESFAIERRTLVELVDLARLSPSASNLQPLKYLLSWEPSKNARIFPHLAWAGHLKDWPGPAEGERPSAYIVILGDARIAKGVGCDHGIAAQSILLGAREKELGGCMLGAIQRDRLREAMEIPEHFEILLVIALGKPREEIVIEPLAPGGDFKYWRTPDGVHHVPKRSLDELILD